MVVKPASLFVGVDFGTSFSGWSSVASCGTDVKLNTSWPDQPGGLHYCKQPTASVYKHEPDGTYSFVAAGYSAHKALADMTPAMRAECTLLRRFKLCLAPDPEDRPALPEGLEPVRVIGEYLRELAAGAREALERQWGPRVAPGGDLILEFCLSVPANWSDSAKQSMREAAVLAGVILKENSTQLRLVHEPEAAVVSVTRDADTHTRMRTGEVVALVDAGGGTVDISVMQLVTRGDGAGDGAEQNRDGFVDVVPRRAVMKGATYLDERFEALAATHLRLSPETWQEWKEARPMDHLRLLVNGWEPIKRTWGRPEWRDAWIDLPRSLLKLLAPDVRMELCEAAEEEDDEEERLRLGRNDMEEIFQELVDDVAAAARGAIKDAGGKVDHLLAVGGFSESPYLLQRLREDLAGSCPQGLVAPTNGAAAVVKGAALYARDPTIVRGRRATLTYGVRVSNAWNLGMPSKHREWDETLRQWRNNHVFAPFVARGQLVEVDEVVLQTFYPVHPHEESVTFDVYATEAQSSAHTSEPGMLRVGCCTVKIAEPKRLTKPLAYPLAVSMSFGQAEVTVTAKDLTSGHSAQTSIVFFAS